VLRTYIFTIENLRLDCAAKRGSMKEKIIVLPTVGRLCIMLLLLMEKDPVWILEK